MQIKYSNYVDPNSAQFKLWNDRFLCVMKEIDTMSMDYIKIFGLPTSGDPLLDKQNQNELVQRYLTVIEMIEYHIKGAQIGICNPPDTKIVYCLIQKHLENWAQELNSVMRPDESVVEELQIMDKFADVVYEHAKWYLDEALKDTPYSRLLTKKEDSILSLLKPLKENKGDTTTVIVHPKRESLSDVFSDGASRLIRRY